MTLPSVAATTTVGPTNYQARVQAGALVDDLLYAITFRQTPPYLVAYDPFDSAMVETHEIPMDRDVDSPGAWNLVAFDDRFLYTVLHEPTVLVRFDRETGSFERLVEFPQSEPNLRCCRGIETTEDRVVFSLKVGPDLYEWVHGDDRLEAFGRVHETAFKAKDLAVDEDTTYVGGGTDAYLKAVDRSSGEMRDILPPELEDEFNVQAVAVAGDGRVIAGTDPNMRVAVFDPAAPVEATVVEPPIDYDGGATIQSLSVIDGVAYFTTTDPTYAIWAYEIDRDDEPRRVAAPIDHPTRDIFDLGGSLLGVGSGGYSAVWTLDLASGDPNVVRLGDLGLPKGVGNVQSFHALGGDVYAGGSRVTDVHHVMGDGRDRFISPGEPKVMCDVDGLLYQGIYGGAGIAEYDPETGDMRELAWVGHEQNRPRDLQYHEPSDLLLMGTRPDYGQLGGAIAAYDIAADELRSVDRHVVEDQTVNALTTLGETVYIGTDIRGGIGSEPTAEEAHIAAWNPVDREIEWSRSLPDCPGVLGLVTYDGRLYGSTIDGSLIGFDPASLERTLVRSVGEAKRSGDLLVRGDRIYGADTAKLYAYDPASDELSVLLDDLDADDAWHNFPQLTVDEEGSLYVARGKDLLQVKLDGTES